MKTINNIAGIDKRNNEACSAVKNLMNKPVMNDSPETLDYMPISRETILTAYHEAGHAVVAILSGLEHQFPSYITIEPDVEKGFSGMVWAWGSSILIDPPSDKNDYINAQQIVEWHCRISAAGDAAEDIICEREFPNDYEDLIHLRLGTSYDDYEQIKSNLDTFYFIKDQEERLQFQNEKIQNIEEFTSALLLEYWNMVETLANALLETGYLDYTEIYQLLKIEPIPEHDLKYGGMRLHLLIRNENSIYNAYCIEHRGMLFCSGNTIEELLHNMQEIGNTDPDDLTVSKFKIHMPDIAFRYLNTVSIEYLFV